MNKTVAMNKTVILGAALCAATLALTGCGGGSSGPAVESSSASTTTPPATSTPQTEMLDTQQVLALAEAQSDTGDPKLVGVGAWMVAGADDETSDPVPVG